MANQDMERVVEIEGVAFSACQFDLAEFNALLSMKGVTGIVAEYKGQVDGFMIYKSTENMFVIEDIAVHPDAWRHGVGASLLSRLFQRLDCKRPTIMARVYHENEGALSFFRNFDFKHGKRQRGNVICTYTMPTIAAWDSDVLQERIKADKKKSENKVLTGA